VGSRLTKSSIKSATNSPGGVLKEMNKLLITGLCIGFSAFALRAGDPAPLSHSSAPGNRQMAVNAMNDLIAHFWEGSPEDGHITRTWGGYHYSPLPNERGALWERATLYFAMDNLHQLTGDPDLARRLSAEWHHVKSLYPAEKLQAVGEDSGTNWACDDAGWSALFYLAAYRATGDPDALADAKGVVNNAYARWLDNELGGGMWYADEKHVVNYDSISRRKSLYQIAIVLTSLHLYEITHEKAFLDPAMNCYDWMESHLLRPDGLYWCDYNSDGPLGASRPNDIHEAGSVSFLGGNMGMGAAHAILYRLTADKKYRQRALRTATALRTGLLVNSNGIFIDDRDAWANGTFAGDWVREVLALPGIVFEDRVVLQKTARAIYTKARTPDGYYGPCWDGVANGQKCPWTNSWAQQIMTSANAVNIIIAGAVAGSK